MGAGNPDHYLMIFAPVPSTISLMFVYDSNKQVAFISDRRENAGRLLLPKYAWVLLPTRKCYLRPVLVLCRWEGYTSQAVRFYCSCCLHTLEIYSVRNKKGEGLEEEAQA